MAAIERLQKEKVIENGDLSDDDTNETFGIEDPFTELVTNDLLEIKESLTEQIKKNYTKSIENALRSINTRGKVKQMPRCNRVWQKGTKKGRRCVRNSASNEKFCHKCSKSLESAK